MDRDISHEHLNRTSAASREGSKVAARCTRELMVASLADDEEGKFIPQNGALLFT